MIEMQGKKFGKLTVLGPSHKDSRGEWRWRCQCECGNISVVAGYKLRSGHTTSCGCVQSAWRKRGPTHTHGMTNTRLYNTWCNMKARCSNTKNYEYHAYGGKGVRVCPDWSKFEAFYEWAIANGYEDGLTIDRIDVNGDYSPDNCRWATQAVQSLNRTDNHLVTAFGKTQTIKEWADEYGLKYDTLERRLNGYHWPAERAISEPLHSPWKRKR